MWAGLRRDLARSSRTVGCGSEVTARPFPIHLGGIAQTPGNTLTVFTAELGAIP